MHMISDSKKRLIFKPRPNGFKLRVVKLVSQTHLQDRSKRLPNIRWYNKVHELIAVKMLRTSLLNTTVVVFKGLPLGSYAPMPAPSPSFKTILELVLWNGLQRCRCITPDVINVIKMPSFQNFLYLREQKRVNGGYIRLIGRVFQHSYLFSS